MALRRGIAFTVESNVVAASKMTILPGSLTAGAIGFLWLKLLGEPEASDDDLDAMNFAATEDRSID